MTTIGRTAIEAAIETGAAIMRVVLDAIAAHDIETLRRVTDVLPAGHPLRSRLALIAGEERARKELGE